MERFFSTLTSSIAAAASAFSAAGGLAGTLPAPASVASLPAVPIAADPVVPPTTGGIAAITSISAHPSAPIRPSGPIIPTRSPVTYICFCFYNIGLLVSMYCCLGISNQRIVGEGRTMPRDPLEATHSADSPSL
jgi:hypothetical protein